MKSLLVACLSLFLLATAARAAEPAIPRTDTLLDTTWKFLKEDPADAQTPTFDDAKWEAITLPHTWNAQDGQDGGNNYYRGPAWYRSHLALKPDAAKEYFLQFDGASTAADVYLNGKKVGSHQGGFAAFCFDITPLLNPAGDNLLAVRITNEKNKHIAPLAGDFTVFGGLYRPVHLLTRNKISISPIDDGVASPGIYLKQTSVTADEAQIEVTVKLRNDTPSEAHCNVITELRDSVGKPVGNVRNIVVVPATSTFDASSTITLKSPHLWDGIKDPYLYTANVYVYFLPSAGNALAPASPIDSDVQPLGLRTFKVDPDKGFFLNGEHYALHGVNRHQDRIDKGWAISHADMDEDYKLMSEMGCTVVRLAHYQHDQHFYDDCDKGGMVVWAELCMVNDIDLSPEFATITKQQLTELIKQNYNHPSICFWSMYNELRMKPTDKPPIDFVVELNDLAHKLDSTRLTVGANMQNVNHPLTKITDVDAINRYDGWYNGTPQRWPATLDDVHKAIPTRAVAVSEYGAGASTIQHEDDVKQPKPNGSRWHPEEWQCVVHEAAWKAMSERPWIWGTFIWTFADFASDGRNEGDHAGRNDKGMVTYDRKTRKDVYYFYQANWTTTPMVHINLPATLDYSPTRIKVYSNAPTVELFVDGKTLGIKTAPDHIFLWEGVTLPQSGAVTIEATATTDSKPLKTKVALTITPAPPK